MSELVLHAEQVNKVYQDGGRDLQILFDVNMTLNAGEQVAIIGASGSGKSTLLNILSGLDSPSSGQVSVGGQDIFALNEAKRAKLRNQQLGFVYQFHHLLSEFSALENIAMPLLIGGETVNIARERAAELLADVGLSDRASHKPGQLSGGERQRIAIARALINRPACVLMDEPTGNLDGETAAAVQALMADLNTRHNTAFLVVTHDLAFAARLDRKYVLEAGRLSEA